MLAENIAKQLRALDIEVPKDIEAVIATRLAVNTAFSTDPVKALATDLLAGAVKPKDVTARVLAASAELVQREKAGEVGRDLDSTLERLARRATLSEADNIIVKARPAFDAAVAAIVEATQLFGSDPDERSVLALGPSAVEAWNRRRAAVEMLKSVRRLRVALRDAGHGDGDARQVEVTWFIATARTQADIDQAAQVHNGKGEGLVNLAASGIPLRLNTPAESAALLTEAGRRTAEATRLEIEATPRFQREARAAKEEVEFLLEGLPTRTSPAPTPVEVSP